MEEGVDVPLLIKGDDLIVVYRRQGIVAISHAEEAKDAGGKEDEQEKTDETNEPKFNVK